MRQHAERTDQTDQTMSTEQHLHAGRGRETRGRRLRRAAASMITSLVVAISLVPAGAAPAYAYPPDPPDEARSRTYLAELVVEDEYAADPYDRDLFPHWSSHPESCSTRELVLQRDGAGVTVGEDCYPDTGSWYSVYDAVWVEAPADVQIDHIVALSEAWYSGAYAWTTDEREVFANDLVHAQLIAVSGPSNQAKSDRDPSEWVPTNESVHCIYAREWIWVKHVYALTVDADEAVALGGLLDTC